MGGIRWLYLPAALQDTPSLRVLCDGCFDGNRLSTWKHGEDGIVTGEITGEEYFLA
jgi:hypothetical protein